MLRLDPAGAPSLASAPLRDDHVVRLRHVLPRLWLAVALLAPALAAAEPKPPTAAENADASFAQEFVGKTFEDEFDIDGWTDLGGGLVAPPIYVHEYQRDADGTYLVLTSREAAKEGALAPASFVVTDALIVPRSRKRTRRSPSPVSWLATTPR